MCSNINFTWMHLRLDEIFPNRNESFGNCNMLVFGDLLQVMLILFIYKVYKKQIIYKLFIS